MQPTGPPIKPADNPRPVGGVKSAKKISARPGLIDLLAGAVETDVGRKHQQIHSNGTKNNLKKREGEKMGVEKKVVEKKVVEKVQGV